ncbi:MAG TPA: alpha/beta hydrolase [Burkholderiaceae bacterium]|nr:alpha/beta hydrolase [Burkholderiaceae bacterium]
MNLERNGERSYAYTGGKPLDPALPGVVFVHGALHDHSVWILQSRYFAHHGRAVLALDLPAHGRSGGAPLGVEAAGRWVAAFIEASGVRRTALVGHSMGSLIALEAAAHLGARASALVMVGTAYPMKVSPKLLELCQRDALAAIDLVNTLSNSTYAAKPSHPGPGFSIHGSNRALMRRMQRGYTAGNLFLADFRACDAYAGLEAAAAKVRCPATLVLGAGDQMTLPQAVAPVVAALKPRVVTLPVGHNLMAEAPDGVLDAIREALSEEPPR